MQYYAISVLTDEGVLKDLTPFYNTQKKHGIGMSIHGAFANIRRMSKYDSFGDYPLLVCMIKALKKLHVPVKLAQVRYLLNHRSEEFKGHNAGKEAIIRTLEPLLV